MRVIAASFLSALVFGLGLIVSGMANPAKVLGFLDLAGWWDPSLAFVMAGAIAVGVVAFVIARHRTVSLLREEMRLPTTRLINRRLIGGSILFGIGWGIAGFCPGPGLVALGMGELKAAVFVLAMITGMAATALIERRLAEPGARKHQIVQLKWPRALYSWTATYAASNISSRPRMSSARRFSGM